jgi:RNA-binding protein
MDILTSGQRQHLRRLAHDLRPIAQVGKRGLTDQVVAAVDEALAAHELIKVKFLEFQDERRPLAETLAEATQSALVGIIGNTAMLYRPHPERERRRVSLAEE